LPICLTRIRNGQTAGKSEVQLASSRLKTAIVKVLRMSYIADSASMRRDKPRLTIGLSISKAGRHRPPGARQPPGPADYRGKDHVAKVLAGWHGGSSPRPRV